jgi:hypothetical protein
MNAPMPSELDQSSRDTQRRARQVGILGSVALFGACIAVLLSALTTTAAASMRPRTNVTKYGISFVLPKGWTQVSLSPGDIGGMLGKASNESASMKSFLTSQALAAAKQGLKFFAISPGGNANVNTGIYSGTSSLDALDVSAKLGVTSIGGKNVDTRRVHFGFGNAIEATYILPLKSPSAPVHGTQFYVAHNGRTYITTFSSGVETVEANAASIMMPTWRFSK